MRKQINYGFIAPVIEKDHFVLGGAASLMTVILQPDGQWDEYMPDYEPQYGEGWDTDGCTIWGTENALEFLFSRAFSLKKNFSERAVYIGTHTRPPGNDPHVVIEWIRGNGLVDNNRLPMTSGFEEFITPDPLTKPLLAEMGVFKSRYSVGHEWVFTGDHAKDDKINRMLEALQYSPLGVSVTAWFEGEDGIYRDEGRPNCHWCVCFGYDAEKRAWKIFDSYDQSVKLYSWDSEISFCKRYSLAENTDAPVKPVASFFELLIAAIISIFKKKK